MLIQRASVQAGYPGSVDGPAFLQWVMDTCYWLLQVVLRPKEKKRFVLLPKRWVVERTNSELLHCRRLVRDDVRLPESLETFIYLAMIRSMVRRLA